MFKLWLLLGFLFVSSAVSAYDNPDKIALIEPGMGKEEALQIIGPPDLVVSRSVNEKGVSAEIYKYDYVPPPAEPDAAQGPFIKPEFSRDAQNVSTQEAAAEQKTDSHPSYIISFSNDIVKSVKKAE